MVVYEQSCTHPIVISCCGFLATEFHGWMEGGVVFVGFFSNDRIGEYVMVVGEFYGSYCI